MTPPSHAAATRTEVEAVLRGASLRPAAIFRPAIYEPKAWFINSAR